MIVSDQERDALMAAVEQYGIHKMQFALSPDGSASEQLADDRADHYFDAIRAMLAPDDAVLRTEVAAVIATRIIHPNAVYMNGPFRSRSEQDRCEWAADEIIAVLRGEATRDEHN